MYFENREEAGQRLAAELVERYRYENCVVVALSDGGVVVGEQIAAALHCILTLLIVETIDVPGESLSFGGISESGQFTYNSGISELEREEYFSEFHGYLEEQKRNAFQRINRLIGANGLLDPDMVRDHVVILVADGIKDGSALDVAKDFLKPLRIQRLIIASAVASVEAVDITHMMADELHILDVKQNYLDTDHYFNKNTLPSHEDTINKINQIILNWR
ncbi:MAG: hypothetical protein JWN33_670 [Candidatus Saccharibacteria bacterium]|nr:hypothetical protein [Candidatus Saccharibacteria bacterium]